MNDMFSSDYSRRYLIALMLLSWVTMLGIDFFLHGGLLARVYNEPSPFLLPPIAAFRLIPLGYLSFLLLAFLLISLMGRLSVATGRAGFLFGLQLGGLIWGALLLGLLSISTISWSLAGAWWLGQTVALACAGAVIGWGLEWGQLRPLMWWVLVMVVALFVLTIILQSIGWH